MEVGDPQPNANLQAIDDIMRDLLDSQRVAIEKLGDKELRTFYENYFPHLWNKRAGNDPESIFRTIFAKRPAKARKPSSKQRKFPSLRGGDERYTACR